MTKQRTDTERLDWLQREKREIYRVDERGMYDNSDRNRFRIEGYPRHAADLRMMLDGAMDAAESAQMDEAWKYIRAERISVWRYRQGEWHYGIDGQHGVGPFESQDAAVLAAYLASKEKR